MGVEKTILKPGNGVDFPKNGDNVAIHYTGCLYDQSKADNHYMGTKYVLPRFSCLLSEFCAGYV